MRFWYKRVIVYVCLYAWLFEEEKSNIRCRSPKEKMEVKKNKKKIERILKEKCVFYSLVFCDMIGMNTALFVCDHSDAVFLIL